MQGLDHVPSPIEMSKADRCASGRSIHPSVGNMESPYIESAEGAAQGKQRGNMGKEKVKEKS